MTETDNAEVLKVGDHVTLTLRGEFDVWNRGALTLALAEAAGARHLTVDAGEVGFLDGRGSGLIIDAIRRIRDAGGTAELINSPSVVRRVISLLDMQVLTPTT